MTLLELGNLVEKHRMMQGINKLDFCKQIELHFHTYNSFLKQDRRAQAYTICTLLKYLKSQGVDVALLNIQF